MYVQKSLAYSTATALIHTVGLNANRVSADVQTREVEPLVRANKYDSRKPRNFEPVARKEQPISQSKKSDPSYGQRVSFRPNLDRRTQSALDVYNTLQFQNDNEEQFNVSKLLGVDLYV